MTHWKSGLDLFWCWHLVMHDCVQREIIGHDYREKVGERKKRERSPIWERQQSHRDK